MDLIKDYDIIGDKVELLNILNMKKREEIIKNHIATFYKIWFNEKKLLYLTYLPDETKDKGRRQISSSSEETLKSKIADFYLSREKALKQKESDERKRNASTLRKLYPEWLKYKSLKTTATSYIRRLDVDWNTFYKNDPIIDTPITDFTKIMLEQWSLKNIKEHNLSKVKYYNMSIIFRQILDYAIDQSLIDVNHFREFKIDSKMFAKKKKPEDSTQVFLKNEKPLIEAEAWDDFKKKQCTTALAIPLAFQIGVRVGELVAIKESDISKDGKYLHIQRMAQKNESQDENGNWLPLKWEIVEHTKSVAGDRLIYLTSEARRIIDTITKTNKELGYYKDGYLFVYNSLMVTPKQIMQRLDKYCKHINIDRKSIHKIRKTYISSLIGNGVNINLVRKLAGHEHETTTLKNYTFDTNPIKESEAILENALNDTISPDLTLLNPTQPQKVIKLKREKPDRIKLSRIK